MNLAQLNVVANAEDELRSAPSTLGEQLRRDIEEAILSGRLVPGDLLDERVLAERHDVSRTPVREALLQLATLGLVTMQPRQPTRVATIGITDFVEMTDVMSCLEAQAARLAARRMDRHERRQLEELQAGAQASVAVREVADFNQWNWKLHQAIFAGSRNNFLAAQARQLRLRLHPYRCLLLRIGDRMPRAHDEHADLVKAIVHGDGEAAFLIMRQHLTLDANQLADLMSLVSNGAPVAEFPKEPPPRAT
jgi:DNA-binding GntR family transcriptional regulator